MFLLYALGFIYFAIIIFYYRDDVERSLLSEIEELELTIKRLMKAAKNSRDEIQHLNSTKTSLEHDINLKTQTLHLEDVDIMALRNTVKIDDY